MTHHVVSSSSFFRRLIFVSESKCLHFEHQYLYLGIKIWLLKIVTWDPATVYYHSMQYSIEDFVEWWNKPFKITSQCLSDKLRRMLKKYKKSSYNRIFFRATSKAQIKTVCLILHHLMQLKSWIKENEFSS